MIPHGQAPYSDAECTRGRVWSRVSTLVAPLVLAVTAGCGASAPTCGRAETIALHLSPRAQLNQDRDGYSRSVVVRLYQLAAVEPFQAIAFDDLWRTPNDGTPQKPMVTTPEELTLLPGSEERRAIERVPEAAYLAVVANFREHQPGSGWSAVVALPPPKNACLQSVSPVSANLTVELKDYGLTLR